MAVRVVVVGKMVVVADIGTYLVLYLSPSFVSCFHYCAIAFGCSLSDLFDFIFVYIFNYPVYAICCLFVSIWMPYVGRGRCSSSSMMV